MALSSVVLLIGEISVYLYEFDGKKLEICPSDVDFFPKFRTLRSNNIFDQSRISKVTKC